MKGKTKDDKYIVTSWGRRSFARVVLYIWKKRGNATLLSRVLRLVASPA